MKLAVDYEKTQERGKTVLAEINAADVGALPVGATAYDVGAVADTAEGRRALAESPEVTGTFVAVSPLPAGITAAGAYDPLRNTYNVKASNTARIRRAKARALGGTGLFRILGGPGDSNTAGVGTTSADFSVAGYPRRVEGLLSARGIPKAGTGRVPTARNASYNGTLTADTRWTFAAAGFLPFSNGRYHFRRCTAASKTATFVSDAPGTVAEITTFTTSSPLTITIDGAAPADGTVTVVNGSYAGGVLTPSGSNTHTRATFTGLSDAVHTIVVTSSATASAGAPAYLISAEVRRAAGFTVSNFGIGATQTADWMPSLGFVDPGPVTAAVNNDTDLAIVQLMLNDAFIPADPVPAATFKANLKAIASAWKTATADVLLVVSGTPSTDPYTNGNAVTAAEWAAYRQAVYEIADELDVPLLDLGARWGTHAAASSAGYKTDSLHPDDQGYADIAQRIAEYILAA